MKMYSSFERNLYFRLVYLPNFLLIKKNYNQGKLILVFLFNSCIQCGLCLYRQVLNIIVDTADSSLHQNILNVQMFDL